MVRETRLDTREDREAQMVDKIKQAIGDAADETVVQMASGGGASNECNTEVVIEELHIHVDDE